ncbi:acyl transferase/acyl hydrolase/lysophospholipase [Hypoxylon sp. FL1857]|nr:acyl transferase/acyl hydrolase/lysophospholipase [Hypoxylon sp. FL1857]
MMCIVRIFTMTRPCSHWIWSSGSETPTIAGSDRLGQLTFSLLPHDPAPSLLLWIGCRRRPAINRTPKRREDRICLDLDKQSEVPILLATAALEARSCGRISCCKLARENHPLACRSVAHAGAIVYSQLLYPFVDVFCFSLYSPNDLEIVATHVALWIESQPAPRSEYPPQFLIILAGRRWKEWDEAAATEKFHSLVKEKTTQLLDSFFPDTLIFRMHRGGHFSSIRPCLVEHIRNVRRKRREAHTLFTVPHFNALFDRAFHDVGRSPTFSFDCLLASRQDFPVSPSMAAHLSNFVGHIPLAQRLQDFAAPVIASSILLDQYPPGMHLFKPSEVYHKLYNTICLEVGRSAFQQDRDDGLLLPSVFTASVLANLESFFTQLTSGQAASTIHRAILASYAEEWHHIRSREDCFICFKSTPQHTASCGHVFCENCIQIFGQAQEADPGLLRLSRCTLCQSQANLVIRIRPPTAGHGILCIDGGGVGGIIPSTVLELIQDSLGLPIPVQEHFSLAYGVSVGGLVVLGLYEKGWSAATCTFKLHAMAEEAFYSPARGFIVLFLLFKWIHLVLLGCLYSARGIESAFVTVFGDKEIVTPSYATVAGTKVGILAATTTKQPTTYLFTNYSGIGGARVGYLLHQSRHAVKTWEVARSTSAAPMYFPPKYIPGIGNLVDGGVVRNNPTIVGLSEFKAMALGTKPDFVINLGTGSSPGSSSLLTDEEPRESRRYRWLSRLVRAYLSHLQGQRTWNDVTSLVKKEPKTDGYYRLDVVLQGKVGLDDIAAMPRLRSLVLQDAVLRNSIGEFAHRLFAALFYFELIRVPIPLSSLFRIQGRILCLRKGGDPALPLILQRLKSSILLIDGKETRFRPVQDAHGNIKATLSFVGSRTISLELEEERSNTAFPFSGSPYILPDLVSCSGLAAPFGTRAHKRKVELDIPERQTRRRRLS